MIIDLIRDSRITRFSWAEHGPSDVSVVEFDKSGRAVLSELLRRPDARRRWTQLREEGWRKLNARPLT